MSSNRRKLRLNTVSVSLGCSCRRPRLSNIFHPKPKPKSKTPSNYPYDYSTTTTTTTTTDASSPPCYSDTDSDIRSLRAVQGFGRIGGESVAVEKDSDDPYLDFRRSMLQMILENEIYSKDDLRELLNCFLQLNSPDYHGVIVRAFTEIWNGVFSVPRLHGGRRSRAF
ncbi:Transcription repressor like [Actinidia chinensis var. chinensis]|uniref:Transcription repressor n=1 Tax=Actinidia chinensis var. chinensis TaxID=1590841 RepID=A0A2R6QVV9_ACTCC|nr:Transcription repressor like [Actinidia chinensis var. chinensis]